jgi:hypothetical protein
LLKVLLKRNTIPEMLLELQPADESDSDGDVEMTPSVLDKAELKVAKANQSRAGKIARQSKLRKRVASGKDDEDISDEQDSEDEEDSSDDEEKLREDSSDDEEKLRVIDAPLVKLVQKGVACSNANDPAALKKYSEFGAFSVRFSDEGSKVATLVACAVANHEVTNINGSGTQMIDFTRACLDKGSVGT